MIFIFNFYNLDESKEKTKKFKAKQRKASLFKIFKFKNWIYG